MLMTQIVFGDSVCCSNSKHFRVSDFGLSTQCLAIRRCPDLGSIRNKLGLRQKTANQVIKLSGNTYIMLFIKMIQEVSVTTFPRRRYWYVPTTCTPPAPAQDGTQLGDSLETTPTCPGHSARIAPDLALLLPSACTNNAGGLWSPHIHSLGPWLVGEVFFSRLTFTAALKPVVGVRLTILRI